MVLATFGADSERPCETSATPFVMTHNLIKVFAYAMAGLICSILTWFGGKQLSASRHKTEMLAITHFSHHLVHSKANVMWVADDDILICRSLSPSPMFS